MLRQVFCVTKTPLRWSQHLRPDSDGLGWFGPFFVASSSKRWSGTKLCGDTGARSCWALGFKIYQETRGCIATVDFVECNQVCGIL